MLGSGAHVKIGDYEYMLEEASQHYSHDFTLPDMGQARQIEGMDGKLSMSARLFWGFDDWSGGEGNKIYYGDAPYTYHYSETLSGRNRGLLTGRPSRTVTTIAADDARKKVWLVPGTGGIWALYNVSDWGQDPSGKLYARRSIDGTTWSSDYPLATPLNGEYVTAACGDREYVFFATTQYDTGTNNQHTYIYRLDRAGTVSAVKTDTNHVPWIGMAMMNGLLYAWTGTKLYSLNVADVGAVTSTLLSPDNFPDLSFYGANSTFWADVIAADSSVVAFTTTDGISEIYEYHEERGFAPLWTVPDGFTIGAIAYQNGAVYVAGTWGGTNSNATIGYGAIYRIELETRQAAFISWVRRDTVTGIRFTAACASYGNQVMFSTSDGRIFVYDADLDGLSLLDDVNTTRWTTSNNVTDTLVCTTTDNEICSLATWGGKRFAGIRRLSTNLITHPSMISIEGAGLGSTSPFTTNNCTIARDTAQHSSGVASLKMTSTAGGTMGVSNTDGALTDYAPAAPVIGGLSYTAWAAVKANAATRSVQVKITFIMFDGTSGGTTTGTASVDSAGGFTIFSVTATAPLGAVAAYMTVEVLATAAGEIHWVDEFNIQQRASVGSSNSADGNVQIVAWSDDELTNRESSSSTGDLAMSQYSPEHDFGMPFDGKHMHGVHLAWDVEDSTTTSGLKAGQSIVVYGTFDGASEVTLATITSASTPSTGIKGRTFVPYLPGGTQLKFFKMKTRTVLKGTRTAATNYQPPALWAAVVEASPANYIETWDLGIRVKNELPADRPTTRKWTAGLQRDYLEALKQTGTAITFLDGARYPQKGEYTTHTVTVEAISDTIERNAEGVLSIRLKAVTV